MCLSTRHSGLRRKDLIKHLEVVRWMLYMVRDDAQRYRVAMDTDAAAHAITDALARLSREDDPYDPP